MARPSKFTDETRKKLIQALSIGCTYELAAKYAGIHEATFYSWLTKGREGHPGFLKFYEDAKKAEAICATGALGVIVQSAREGDWKAAAWFLERRHGYTNRDKAAVEINIDAESKPVIQMIQELREDSELALLLNGPKIDLDE